MFFLVTGCENMSIWDYFFPACSNCFSRPLETCCSCLLNFTWNL